MLYYCPLELYEERYTIQWCAPKTGWLERNWIKHQIPYKRIDSPWGVAIQEDIKTGIVLDVERRTQHSFSQINQIISLAVNGEISNKDIIYFDDFWHPGIEALPYTFHLLNIKPKMFAFCHAQSVDEFDFTHPMRNWMRHFEKGIGRILTGIFVNSSILKKLLSGAGIAPSNNIHVIGHIFCEEEVRERMPKTQPTRENNIIFSSRWDDEKNPTFFLQVAHKVLKARKDIKFIICTSQKKLRSNNKNNLLLLQKLMNIYPDNIILREGLTKEEYYEELTKAKIQMNTSSQDFVSIVLLEASVAGCHPLYPWFRSFPEALRECDVFMYESLSCSSAMKQLIKIIDTPYLWNKDMIKVRAWIHKRHNSSWARMINIMMRKTLLDVEPYL
jgi:glycosyltransferase involved in cell wall biosynthesis